MNKNLKPQNPIGIFDSGLGGLAVFREIRKIMPNEDILFVGDTGRQPYGPRTVEEVRNYSLQISRFLFEQGAKTVVIGCNTATVSGLDAVLHDNPELMTFGMISPGVKEALNICKSGKIGIWGTEITAAEKAYDKAIHIISPQTETLSVECPNSLRLAEKQKLDNTALVEGYLAKEFEPIESFGADVLILGCTDFTCMRDMIDHVTAGKVHIVDPAKAVAQEVYAYLEKVKCINHKNENGNAVFYVTGEDYENFSIKGGKFLDSQPLPIERISVTLLESYQ